MQDCFRRNQLQLFPNLFPNRLHHFATLRALAFLFRERMLCFYDLNVFGKDIPDAAGGALPGMGTHLHGGGFFFLRGDSRLRFIE